ncbi:hypothetical protein EAS64_15710 [Trebonia kvetii]|uniref:Ig-like domain-containing protein n=1 Tax=Trebonia kvetii TaxID=2480626 RepID=A0A6P2C079_9ACTN|nr:hypothetical protein [Trebonia kvetii]TVZ03886.1 hypothetical protein EAS64_15710 [Trebonia kvetii]
MRKIVMSGLAAATAALLGCAVPAMAGTGTARTSGTVTATAGGKSAETAFLKAISAYPATSAAGRIASSLERLSAARPQASSSSMDVTVGTGVSCASPTACLTVGGHEVSSTNSSSITPFAARLHAGTWKVVPVKAPKGSKFALLTGVSCRAATSCLVLGEAATGSFPGLAPFALAWNGSTLTPVAAPPLPAHTFGQVGPVSCVAVNSCVAIGSGMNETTSAGVQIIWTWNGTKWARTTVPDADPNTEMDFSGLHCFSLTSCVVTGSSLATTSSTGTSTPVAAAWNGKAFADLQATLPAGVSDPMFSGLSCVTAHSCVVVGSGNTSSTGAASLAFAEVWNGKTWAVTKWSGPKGDSIAELVGVSCTSAVRCIAVGDHGTAKTGAPAALAWTGSKWTVLKVAGPGAGKAAVFVSISCPVGGKCVATGLMGKADLSTATAIAGYWNGSTWKYGPMLPAAA